MHDMGGLFVAIAVRHIFFVNYSPNRRAKKWN